MFSKVFTVLALSATTLAVNMNSLSAAHTRTLDGEAYDDNTVD